MARLHDDLAGRVVTSRRDPRALDYGTFAIHRKATSSRGPGLSVDEVETCSAERTALKGRCSLRPPARLCTVGSETGADDWKERIMSEELEGRVAALEAEVVKLRATLEGASKWRVIPKGGSTARTFPEDDYKLWPDLKPMMD